MLLDTLKYAVHTRIGRKTWPIFALAMLLPITGYSLSHPETGMEAQLFLPFLLTGSASIALVCWFFMIELVRHGELEQVAWNAGNEGALLIDASGTFRRSNRVMENWLGIQPSGRNLQKKDWDDLLTTAQQKRGQSEGWVQGRSCRHFIHVRIYDLNSYRRGWTMAVFLDKTDEHLRTQQIRHAREQAEQASKAKDKIMAVLDREVRNPIGGITGWTEITRLELAENNALNESLEECLEGIDQCASDLQTLVIETLEHEPLETSSSRASMERVFMNDFLNFWTENFQRYFAKRKNEFKLIAKDDVRDEVLEIQVRYLRKLLMSLIGSAWRHTDGGKVELELKVLNSPANELCQLGFSIRDNGGGRNAGECEKILLGAQNEAYAETDHQLGLVQAARFLKAIRASSISCSDLASGGLEIRFEVLAARVSVADLAPMTKPKSIVYLTLNPDEVDSLGMFDNINWEPSINLALQQAESADIYFVCTDVPDLTEQNLAQLKHRGQVIIVADQDDDDHDGYLTLKKPLDARDILSVRKM